MVESKSMRTTTLVIDNPTDFSLLNQKFRLVYYELPVAYRRAPNTSKKFEKLHIQLKDQITQPFKVFTYALIAGQYKQVVYVLYRRGEVHAQGEQPITLKYERQEMQPLDIEFDQLPLHVLIKLLQADYFRGNRAGAFVSQADFFVLAHQGREGNGAVCLKIEVKGDRKNTDDMPQQVFQVIGSARRFIKVDLKKLKEESSKVTPYFRREVRDNDMIFRQMRAKEIPEYLKNGGTLFKISRWREKPAKLVYHDQLNLFTCRGGILYTFINNFREYLERLDITATQKIRLLAKYSVSSGDTALLARHLGKIYIYDNRLAKDEAQLEDYLEFLGNWLNKNEIVLDYELINELPTNSTTPILLLQDHEAEDFIEGGKYAEAGYADPKKVIYDDPRYKLTPKQSLNIVSLPDEKTKDLRTQVALNQLLLKDLILNTKPINGVLWGFPLRKAPLQLDMFSTYTSLDKYAFVRRKTFDGQSRMVLLQIDRERLVFSDLSDDLNPAIEACEQLGLNWADIFYKMHEINFRTKNGVVDDKKELKRFDLILRQGQAIYIEDVHETVLYEYEAMDQRRQALTTPIPIDQLRLTRLFSSNEQIPKDVSEFNALLDELAEELPGQEISFENLTRDDIAERVGMIFDLKRNAKGKFQFGPLKKKYQRLEMFLSDKATVLQTYQGIWYDEENRYLVGEPDGIQRKQQSANIIRQFTVLAGYPDVDIQLLLSTTGVQFIRPKRYTVYPYFFNLIDMFLEL